jgi:hypothetical protein
MNGGIINGQQVDGVSYVLGILGDRYAQLGEETRLKTVTDLMTFHRRGNERIEELLTRFEILRQRASGEATMTMSIEGLSWLLLRACHVNDQQLLQLLADFRGRFPTNEVEMRTLYTSLRRMGHILERSTNNIATQLRVPHVGATAYMTYNFGDGWGQQPMPSSHDGGWYVSDRNVPMSSSSSWETGNQWQSSSSGWNQSPALWTAPPPSQQWNSQGWAGAPAVYHSADMDVSGNETDTDTVSSCGETPYDYGDLPQGTPDQQAEHLFWVYQKAKGRFRRFMNKPVRRVRRFMKRKGKGKGKHPGHYLASLSDMEVEATFFGKGPEEKARARERDPSEKAWDAAEIQRARMAVQ